MEDPKPTEITPGETKATAHLQHRAQLRKSFVTIRRVLVATVAVFCVCCLVYTFVHTLVPMFRGHIPTTGNVDIPHTSSLSVQEESNYPESINNLEDESFKPSKRYELSEGQAACWPSTGGIWIKEVTPIEIAHLGLDRFNDTERSTDPVDEDAFCKRLRMSGAQLYQLPPHWNYPITWCENVVFCTEPIVRVHLALGFPSKGGVWVLDTSGSPERFPPGMGGLSNAFTMEERCTVLKKLGGKFCSNMKACPETAKLVD
ncbi:MAG: hypothetical protein M4579_003395 [Chaenotheca gracillima]|nr:MAG: hypothetical protein M4579_003395 [Chaenotheca gracillima]